MPRPVWSGAISFGLVNVDVKAYTAVRDHDVHFRQLDKETGSRVRYQKVAEKTGDELELDDIELGPDDERCAQHLRASLTSRGRSGQP